MIRTADHPPGPDRDRGRRWLRPAALLAAVLCGYAGVAAAVQILLGDSLNHLLAAVGLAGLGPFLWVFGLLLLLLEAGRHAVTTAIDETVRAVAVFRQGERSPGEAIWLHAQYEQERTSSGLLPPLEPDSTTSADDPVGRPALSEFLALRISRCRDWVQAYGRVGEVLAGQTGLIGTLFGLQSAFRALGENAKYVGEEGGGLLSLLGQMRLDTAFSTSIVGAYMICFVVVCSALLGLRVAATAHALRRSIGTELP